jgi:hypothetical protein
MVGPLVATALNNGSSVAAAMNGLRPLLAKAPPPNGVHKEEKEE